MTVGVIGIGLFEIVVVLAIMLIVLGPERMPEVIRMLAKVVRELRAAASEMRDQVEQMGMIDELRKPAEAVRDTLRQADVREELKLQAPETAPDDGQSPAATGPVPDAPAESPGDSESAAQAPDNVPPEKTREQPASLE